jgi:hypothetical protein
MDMLRLYFKLSKALRSDPSKTAHALKARKCGLSAQQVSHTPVEFCGRPHTSQTIFDKMFTLFWQSTHQRIPTLPHPPHEGGKSRSRELHKDLYNKYGKGFFFKLRLPMTQENFSQNFWRLYKA